MERQHQRADRLLICRNPEADRISAKMERAIKLRNLNFYVAPTVTKSKRPVHDNDDDDLSAPDI